MKRRLPPEIERDFRVHRAAHTTISGAKTRLELDDLIDESDHLPGFLPFAMDGGGAVFYVDVEGTLGTRDAIVMLHMSEDYGGTRRVASSYAELKELVVAGFDPFALPSLDDEATENAKKSGASEGVRVPGVDGLVDIVRMHAGKKPRPWEVVPRTDVVVRGHGRELRARAGKMVLFTRSGALIALTLAQRAVVSGFACRADTDLVMNDVTGRPYKFTPDEDVVVEGLPLAAGHEVHLYDDIHSPTVSGTLARDVDVEGVPLAGGTYVVLFGEERALHEGTLRKTAKVGKGSKAKKLAAGTWFELMDGELYRTRP